MNVSDGAGLHQPSPHWGMQLLRPIQVNDPPSLNRRNGGSATHTARPLAGLLAIGWSVVGGVWGVHASRMSPLPHSSLNPIDSSIVL